MQLTEILADESVDAVPVLVDRQDVCGHDTDHADGKDEGNQGGGHLPVIAAIMQCLVKFTR